MKLSKKDKSIKSTSEESEEESEEESKESEESSIVNTPSIINKSNLQLLLKHVFTDGVFLDKNKYDFPNLKLSNVDLSEWNSQKNEKNR